MYDCLAFYEYKMARKLNNKGDKAMKRQVCFIFASVFLAMCVAAGVAVAEEGLICPDDQYKADCCTAYSDNIYWDCIINPSPDIHYSCSLTCEIQAYENGDRQCNYIVDLTYYHQCMLNYYNSFYYTCYDMCMQIGLDYHYQACLLMRYDAYDYCMAY